MDFKEERAVNPIERPAQKERSAALAAERRLNGLRRMRRVFHATRRFLQVFVILCKNYRISC